MTTSQSCRFLSSCPTYKLNSYLLSLIAHNIRRYLILLSLWKSEQSLNREEVKRHSLASSTMSGGNSTTPPPSQPDTHHTTSPQTQLHQLNHQLATFTFQIDKMEHTFPLLRLPGEVRNKIYAYVFDTPESWVVTFHYTTVTCTPEPASTQSFSTFLALTTTCRQIRAETHLMPWKRCVWKYTFNRLGSYLTFLRWWVRADPSLRQLAWEGMSKLEQKFSLHGLRIVEKREGKKAGYGI
jgi:hypothetical protein